ncbi:MAG: DUF354 domain-containing protein [Candidatus Heimdallarchaeota archaeon]|nr:DUF354 domain-containing protein [Candidatus Heimdallarchaeota archaeon]
MIYLIDLLHPTEFHFFYPIIKELEARGDKVILTVRKEEVLIDLLDHSQLNYKIISKKAKNLPSLLFELISRTIKLFKIARSAKVDIFLGMSTLSTSIVGKLLKKPTILITECEDMGPKTKLVFKLASMIITPKLFEKDLGKKHIKFNGLIQLNYLHPNYFTPDREIVEELLNIDLDKEKYFILRFCDWKASHDINQRGFSKEVKWEIIKNLSKIGRVYILDEKKNSEFKDYNLEIPKNLMLNLLAFSSLTITETTSVSIESALLGVPVVRCTSLAETRKGGAAIFTELEKQGLVFSYSNEILALKRINEILEKKINKEYSQKKRDEFIKNFNPDIKRTIINLINSFE